MIFKLRYHRHFGWRKHKIPLIDFLCKSTSSCTFHFVASDWLRTVIILVIIIIITVWLLQWINITCKEAYNSKNRKTSLIDFFCKSTSSYTFHFVAGDWLRSSYHHHHHHHHHHRRHHPHYYYYSLAITQWINVTFKEAYNREQEASDLCVQRNFEDSLLILTIEPLVLFPNSVLNENNLTLFVKWSFWVFHYIYHIVDCSMFNSLNYECK